jgi:small-conductance mechanosensitive channel
LSLSTSIPHPSNLEIQAPNFKVKSSTLKSPSRISRVGLVASRGASRWAGWDGSGT